MAFVFRFFFDSGSGTCLWSASKETEAIYDYPVDHRRLPISDMLKQQLDWLVETFDTDYDWGDPLGEGKWSDEERLEFWRRSKDAVIALRQELPLPPYEIRDETQPNLNRE